MDTFTTHFVGLVLELLLYGVYAVLFAGTVWVLVKRRRESTRDAISWVIDGCSWFIFVTLTIHCIASIYLRYEGLVAHATDRAGAEAYLARASSRASLVRYSMYGLTAMGMEIMLIYRLWVVWGHSRAVVVLPTLLMLFDVAGFGVILYGDARNLAVPGLDIYVWSAVIFICEALTNLLCAVLIAWRILRETRIVGRRLGHGLQPVLLIVVESAAIYVTLTLLLVGGIFSKQAAMVLVLLDIIPAVAGITTCALIVRVGLGMAAHSLPRSTPSGLTFAPHAGSTASSAPALKVGVTRHALVSRDDGAEKESAGAGVFEFAYPPRASTNAPQRDGDAC